MLCQILNPSINSISYLRVLISLALVSSNKKGFDISEAYQPGSLLWAKALDFIDHFDPVQIRYSGQEMRYLIEATAESAMHHRKVIITIRSIKDLFFTYLSLLQRLLLSEELYYG